MSEIPSHHITLTDSNGLTTHQVSNVLTVVKKHFNLKHDVVVEHGKNGTNRHIHMIVDSNKRTDKIRDIFKKLYTQPQGDVREYWKRRLCVCSNKKTLAESFVYHRKEIDHSSPYCYANGESPQLNSDSHILSTTFTDDYIQSHIDRYIPDVTQTLVFRKRVKTINKSDLIHTLDAYASQVYPAHDNVLTHKEYKTIIQRMTVSGYVLYHHVNQSTYHWLNVYRGDNNSHFLDTI